MSNSPLTRRMKIVTLLEETDYADVSNLSSLFQVSEMTIRRDLESLEKAGDVIRVHGGVKLKTKRVYEASIEKRLNTNKPEKMAIAKEAANLIEDGDVIAFDASTTAFEVSKLIKSKKKLTVVTNNISIAIELSDTEEITVILLGGFLRGKSLSLVGSSLHKYLQSIYIDKAFISSKALNFTEGLTDATIDEGEAKQALIDKSNQVFVLVDHTKLGKLAFFEVCGKNKIDKILTDQLDPLLPEQQECIDSYLEYGTEVVIAR
ncbi:MAG: DeoR/GlpR family DNA-binding transcription regulator [Bacillus sp. (in: Bacteria)]|nr:DeoR/GlpR family DNA-binding transcription regulator [Bacillus sp. (in: firmicutes)]